MNVPDPHPPSSAAGSPLVFRGRGFEFRWPGPARVMGILNVTPDSFSDGGHYFDVEAAVAHGEEMAASGAALIDIGGESTRPGATPVPAAEERRRVLPVIERLAARTNVPLSIDTRKPEIAQAALDAGAAVVNDVAAGRSEDTMLRLVASSGAGYVCMHMRGTPATMQEGPEYGDVLAEVGAFFVAQRARLAAAGVALEQVVFDVGIGFGKTVEHNLQLLGGLRGFTKLGRPLLLGVSRKSFIGKVLGGDTDSRLPGSLAAACWAALAGVQLFRVHDVAETVQALRLLETIRARAS